jgi:hypothetical protein
MMNHINIQDLGERVDMRNNDLGTFRDECQPRIGGKKKRL